jgi:hypothetical protein
MGFRIECPDGSVIELDEETTRMLYASAAREQTPVDVYFRSLINTEALLIEAGAGPLDAYVKRLCSPPRTRRRR